MQHTQSVDASFPEYHKGHILAGLGQPEENRPQHTFGHRGERQQHLGERQHITENA